VIDWPEVEPILSILDHILGSVVHANTSVVILSDTKQRREITTLGGRFDFDKLAHERRVFFVYKPLKPVKMAVVFDPKGETEVATDESQTSAQAVAQIQKAVFEELKSQFGNKGLRVLMVEDNRTNQMVSNSRTILETMTDKA